MHASLKSNATSFVKRGKQVCHKEDEAQILYCRFKRRDLESKTQHHQLHDDNTEEKAEMGKDLEF